MKQPALLFDLDGTLIDSDPLHAEVYIEIFADRGMEIDHDFYLREVHGMHNTAVFGKFFPDEDPHDLHLYKEARFREILPGRGRAIPGAIQAVKHAIDAGRHVAVVTNAPRLNSDASLGAIGLDSLVDFVVVGEECHAGKPDPAPYLAALERLGIPARAAIAFEDSPTGAASAVAAGIETIGVRSSLDDAALRAAGCNGSIEDFNDTAYQAFLVRREGASA